VRRVFADTHFWIAVFVPGDEWAEAARGVDLSDASLVTTEEVLSEFLTAVCDHGDHARRLACELVREILDDPRAEVVVQSHESFLAGLALYERRPDKEYSFTDCISMNVMRQKRVQEVRPTTGTSRRKGLSGYWTGESDPVRSAACPAARRRSGAPIPPAREAGAPRDRLPGPGES
jgi:uncharacterized protein